MADVTSSAENKGTAMKKVADLFVRLGQRGIIVAVIPMIETRPRRTCERILAISGRAKEQTRGSAIRFAQARSCRARTRTNLRV
jgi:hypothetical protein